MDKSLAELGIQLRQKVIMPKYDGPETLWDPTCGTSLDKVRLKGLKISFAPTSPSPVPDTAMARSTINAEQTSPVATDFSSGNDGIGQLEPASLIPDHHCRARHRTERFGMASYRDWPDHYSLVVYTDLVSHVIDHGKHARKQA